MGSLCCCYATAQEYERIVIFRNGKVVRPAKGPGLVFLIPCLDEGGIVDVRTMSLDIPSQEVLTKDIVSVKVDAVVHCRIKDAVASVVGVEDVGSSTLLMAATSLRAAMGTRDLAQLLSDRELIGHAMESYLHQVTEKWGIHVERVEIRDVKLPVSLQRAMAVEAEAARETRAKIIAAEGEIIASKALKEASQLMVQNPLALQVCLKSVPGQIWPHYTLAPTSNTSLRYLQTLGTICSGRKSKVFFPFPLEYFNAFKGP